MTDEVTNNCDCLSVLAINGKLDTARVFVKGYERAAVGLGHDVVVFFHDVDAGRLDGMGVPQVDHIHHEFRSNFVEQIVPMMMFVDEALGIGGLLKEEVGVLRCCL